MKNSCNNSCGVNSCGGGRNRRNDGLVLSTGVGVAILSSVITISGSGKKSTAAPAAVEAPAAAAESEEPDGSKLVKPSLVASTDGLSPGGASVLAVAFDISKGWHTYWQNSGDSGAPPSFEFSVDPPGAVVIGEAKWATPERHVSPGDILDYIYEGRVLHLFEAKAAPDLKVGTTVTVTCKASWLVCNEGCIPGEGGASLQLTVKEAAPASGDAAEIGAWMSRTPKQWGASGESPAAEWKDGVLRVRAASKGPIAFFPFAEQGDVVPVNLLKGGESREGILTLRFDDADMKKGGAVRGVVAIGGRTGTAWNLQIPVPAANNDRK